MSRKFILGLAGLLMVACAGFALASTPTPDLEATVNAQVATQLAGLSPTLDLAATINAQATQLGALTQSSQPTNTPPPTPTLTDEAAIKLALLAKLGWSEPELEFSIGYNDGKIAQGGVKRVGEFSGAAWFAGRDSGGQWVVAYIGQGVPPCADIQPFNFPKEWISHCIDASGNTIER